MWTRLYGDAKYMKWNFEYSKASQPIDGKQEESANCNPRDLSSTFRERGDLSCLLLKSKDVLLHFSLQVICGLTLIWFRVSQMI